MMTNSMPRFLRLPALALMAATIGGFASAQSAGDSLTPTSTFTPVFTFTETHSEKVVEITDTTDPTVKYGEVQAVDAMNLCIKASMAGQALADVGPDTGFSLELGDLSVQFSLSDDPNYKAGNTSAFLSTHGWDASGNPIGTEGLTLSWTADTLTIKLINSANSDADAGPFFPAFSQGFIGETNPSIRNLSSVSLSFGSITGDATVYVSGSAATTTQAYNNGGFSDSLDITQASVSGALDFSAPTVAVTGTADATDGSGGSTVSGTAIDGHGVASVEVTSTPADDTSWQQANIDSSTPLAPEAEWSADTVHWSFDVSAFGIGSTVISVRATDVSGNVSAPVTFTVVRDVPPALAGRWDALVAVDDESGVPTGVVTFNCSTAGTISGKLTLRDSGRTFPFTGTWSGDTITATIVRPGLTSLAFSATAPSIDVTDAADAWLDGTLTEIPAPVATAAALKNKAPKTGKVNDVTPVTPPADPVVVGMFGAFRSPYSALNPVSTDLVGRYNGSVSGPDLTTPLGTSFLSLNARPSGSTVIVGRLADGTPFSWSGRLGASGQVPVYAPLYARKGLLSALLNIDGQSLYSDTGVWLRPAGLPDGQFADGFTADSLSVDGQFYTAPVSPDLVLGLLAGTGNANIDLSGDGLATDINITFTVGALNRATFDAPNTEGLRLTFGKDTGNVTGAFKLPDGTPGSVTFRGLIVGDQAVGFYVAPPATGTTVKRYGSLTVSSTDSSNGGGVIIDPGTPTGPPVVIGGGWGNGGWGNGGWGNVPPPPGGGYAQPLTGTGGGNWNGGGDHHHHD